MTEIPKNCQPTQGPKNQKRPQNTEEKASAPLSSEGTQSKKRFSGYMNKAKNQQPYEANSNTKTAEKLENPRRSVLVEREDHLMSQNTKQIIMSDLKPKNAMNDGNQKQNNQETAASATKDSNQNKFPSKNNRRRNRRNKQTYYQANSSSMSLKCPSKSEPVDILENLNYDSQGQNVEESKNDQHHLEDSLNPMANLKIRIPSRSEPAEIEESWKDNSREELIEMYSKSRQINQSLQKNLQQNQQEIEAERRKPNQERKFFILNEQLRIENDTLDYKDFYLGTLLQRDSNNIKTLRKTVCSFLNTNGGRIYLGVHDAGCKVRGMYLTKNDRDSIQNYSFLWFKSVTPSASDLITIRFVPIKEEEKYCQVPGLFIVKIVVKPGKINTLYSSDTCIGEYWTRCGCSTVPLKLDHLFENYEQRKAMREKKVFEEAVWDDPDLENSLIDMNFIYNLEIKTTEILEKEKIIRFLKSAGISCLGDPYISKKTFVASFLLERFRNEVARYFMRYESVLEAPTQSQKLAPLEMMNLLDSKLCKKSVNNSKTSKNMTK